MDAWPSDLWEYPDFLQEHYFIFQLSILKMTWKSVVKGVYLKLEDITGSYSLHFIEFFLSERQFLTKILVSSQFFIKLWFECCLIFVDCEKHNGSFKNIVKCPLKIWVFFIDVLFIRETLTGKYNVSEVKFSKCNRVDDKLKVLFTLFLVNSHKKGQFE